MRKKIVLWIGILAQSAIPFFFCLGCASFASIPPEPVKTVYVVEGPPDRVDVRFAPAFVAHQYSKTYNRIGTLSAVRSPDGQERVFVDPHKAVVFSEVRTFSTASGTYTNLIYRVHFSEVPFTLIPLHYTAGYNVGLLVVVTLNAAEKPILVTTVHTCGCYAAVIPTAALPLEAHPENRTEGPLDVYGERLPSRLDYSSASHPRLMVHLRPGVHRVMDLQITDDSDLASDPAFRLLPATMEPADHLEKIPIQGGTTSFYFRDWPLTGHVKGSFKGLESLTLGIVSLDFYVGMDKVYGDENGPDNPFYTSLRFWNREKSDMRFFARFLRFWGWRL